MHEYVSVCVHRLVHMKLIGKSKVKLKLSQEEWKGVERGQKREREREEENKGLVLATILNGSYQVVFPALSINM